MGLNRLATYVMRAAGLGLAAFSGGLLTMYFRNDAMTKSDGIRPSDEGTPLAKDSWLAAIALALLLSGNKKDCPNFGVHLQFAAVGDRSR